MCVTIRYIGPHSSGFTAPETVVMNSWPGLGPYSPRQRVGQANRGQLKVAPLGRTAGTGFLIGNATWSEGKFTVRNRSNRKCFANCARPFVQLDFCASQTSQGEMIHSESHAGGVH